VHTQLIVDLGRAINRQVRPRYSVSIEERTYVTLWLGGAAISVPDVMVVQSAPRTGTMALAAPSSTAPMVAELPMPEEVTERFLEVCEVVSGAVITAIEVLSPSNKLTQEGRTQYQQKRIQVLGSKTHLVEIDLLRAGRAMEMEVAGNPRSDYRIVVSRSQQRPWADLHLFSIRQPIPSIPIPLQPTDPEPIIDLNAILHELYDSLSYDLKIDYTRAADPPLRGEEAAWTDELLRQHNLRE
jgi:hypothetical protein